MFKLNSSSDINDEPIEEVIELINANTLFFQNNKVNKTDTLTETKNNAAFKQNLSPDAKDIRNQEDENMDAANEILSYSTLRFPKTSPQTREEQVEIIANHIERKSKLKHDNSPASELARVEMIKNMPQNLTLKRAIKIKLESSTNEKFKQKPIGHWKKIDSQLNKSATNLKVGLHQIRLSFKFWSNSIKTIEGHFGSGIASYFKFLRWLFLINILVFIISNTFITLPQMSLKLHKNESFRASDILLGNGFFTNSIIYYGFYVNNTLFIDSKYAYNIPTAYFLTFLFCYFLTCILLCFKVARSYKKCYIETSGGAYNRYANKIFCSWDWGISSKKAANLRSVSIYRELEELLWDTKNSTVKVSFSMKFWTFLIRISMTTLILSIICGTGTLLWLLLNEYKTDESNILSIMLVPSIMTLIINLIPPLISWSVKYENYAKDRIAIYISMVRVYVIALIAVATLLTFWLTQDLNEGCWQTKLAQEIYRLIIFDLIFSIFGVFFLQYIRSFGFFQKRFGSPTFDITRNTLNLIYNQILFWHAHYFSPPLALVVLVKLLVTFYVKRCELLQFCEPPRKFWRAAQMQTVFLAMTLFGLVSSIVVLGFIIAHVNTNNCGPFIGHNYTWEFVIEKILLIEKESKFWNVLKNITHPGFTIFLLIIMSMAVYYLRAKAQASRQMVQILREMLVWQSRDKEFLQKSFKAAAAETSLVGRLPRPEVSSLPRNTENGITRQVDEPSTSHEE